jgi:hypothetical protein
MCVPFAFYGFLGLHYSINFTYDLMPLKISRLFIVSKVT